MYIEHWGFPHVRKTQHFTLMAFEDTCCTCAALLSSTPPGYDKNPADWHVHKHVLGCCGRTICSRCISTNKRFAKYCPFCQISFVPSSLPPGLRDPPTYSPPSPPQAQGIEQGQNPEQELPPAYDEHVNTGQSALAEPKNCQVAEDVLHFVNPDHDSISSLSLKYRVPVDVLKRKNDIFADHLLAARRCILIPGEYYGAGVSFSPQPIDGEEEDLKKGKIRRWMMACKVAE